MLRGDALLMHAMAFFPAAWCAADRGVTGAAHARKAKRRGWRDHNLGAVTLTCVNL